MFSLVLPLQYYNLQYGKHLKTSVCFFLYYKIDITTISVFLFYHLYAKYANSLYENSIEFIMVIGLYENFMIFL